MCAPKRVMLLFGGVSEEYDISCMSAQNILRGLEEAGHIVCPVGIARNGRWFAPVNAEHIIRFDPETSGVQEVSMLPKPGSALFRLSDGAEIFQPDVVFPIIHGKTGEDGRIQGFLDLCQLPYVGCGAQASAVGMDKVYMKDILNTHGIQQIPYVVVYRHDHQTDAEASVDRVSEALTYPVFVKPANGGSSVGCSQANNAGELHDALALAARYDRKILVEQALLRKREIELAVLGNVQLAVSQPGEVLSDQDFYDYRAKYESKVSRTQVPADLSDDETETIRTLGARIYRALDLSGMARVDFFIDLDRQQILLNEVNTLPGFTAISLYQKMWEQAGKPLPALLNELLDLAMADFQARKNDISRV